MNQPPMTPDEAIDFLCNHFDADGIKINRFATQHGICRSSLYRAMSRKTKLRGKTKRKLISVARCLKAEGQAAAQQNQSFLMPSSPEELMEKAVRTAASEHPARALYLAASAFDQARHEPDGFERGLRLLPSLLYIGNRAGSDLAFAGVINDSIIPFVESDRKVELRRRESEWRLLVVLVACALNECGASELGGGILDQQQTALLKDRHVPSWVIPMVLRNRAHYVGWTLGLADQVKDLACHALERDPSSPQQKLSFANTMAESCLYLGRPAQAWTHCRPTCELVQGAFAEDGNLHKAAKLSFNHAFGAYLYATGARCILTAEGYSPQEADRDISILEKAHRRCSGPLRISHRPGQFDKDQRLPERLRTLFEKCAKPSRHGPLYAALLNLNKQLHH